MAFFIFASMKKLIGPQTTIKELLEGEQELVVESLIKLKKNFSKLKNPVLRNLLARRVTIASACKIAGCEIADFMEAMRKIGFVIGESVIGVQESPSLHADIEIKKWSDFVELDVRPIIDAQKDPLKMILSCINGLKSNQGLKLINSFEPSPLINLLAEKGFGYFTVSPDDNTVITYFRRNKINPEDLSNLSETTYTEDGESFDATLNKIDPAHIKYLDVRQLEMPKPMVLIMQNAPDLGSGDAIFVYHKKRPVFLIPELEKLGLKYFFKDISDGNVHMLIYKS
jgi:uncharacterized protein (DUF2249 family)